MLAEADHEQERERREKEQRKKKKKRGEGGCPGLTDISKDDAKTKVGSVELPSSRAFRLKKEASVDRGNYEKSHQ